MANTVFVLGAGASKEVALPTGYELKNKIQDLLNIRFEHWSQSQGDYLIVESLRRVVQKDDGSRGDINPYLHQAAHIREALPQAISIDNFIDAHRDNKEIELCGKLAIVRAILQSEQSSLLYFDRNQRDKLDFKALENTWFLPFFQLLTENCGIDDLEERFSQVSLIIFNYDRCLEHFLINALMNYYKVLEEQAAQLVNMIRIYHPYGAVGYLPWQNQGNVMNFGEDPNAEQLLEIAKGIKTFTEGTAPDSSEISEIRNCIKNTERLVFLGFAFHELNMELLKPNGGVSKTDFSNVKCFATALDISNSDKSVITEQISELYLTEVQANMADVTCKDLFIEYRRSLAFRRMK